MTTIWQIEQLIVAPTKGEFTKVVITAAWRCNGADGNHFGTCCGTASFEAPSEPFTPFDDLTKEQVLGWVWDSGVDKSAIEQNVADQIERSKNPPTVSLPLPWDSAPAPSPLPAE